MNTKPVLEANFDGLVGPSHNYGGLGVGNLASLASQSQPSFPKAGALQGLKKMQAVAELGVPQFFLPPCPRPHFPWLEKIGFRGKPAEQLKKAADASIAILSSAYASAFMWTANAATVTPSTDNAGEQLHITPANLASNLHRHIESDERYRQLQQIFSRVQNAVTHSPLPAAFPLRDEGAANHMRLSNTIRQPEDSIGGIHIFVDGDAPTANSLGGYFSRHGIAASQAIARRHDLSSEDVFYLHQNPHAINAGVFHNDVIATSHEHLFIHHELAFEDSPESVQALQQIENRFSEKFGQPLVRVEVRKNDLSLKEAVGCYLFNSQIVTNKSGGFTILSPDTCQRSESARTLIEQWIEDPNIPIDSVTYLALDQSMANGGGPACLRLRVQLTATQLTQIPPVLRINEDRITMLTNWIEKWYPQRLEISDLARIDFAEHCLAATSHLHQLLGFD